MFVRLPIAIDPLGFGRNAPRELSAPEPVRARLADDIKLFATTFLAGFIFVSVYLA